MKLVGDHIGRFVREQVLAVSLLSAELELERGVFDAEHVGYVLVHGSDDALLVVERRVGKAVEAGAESGPAQCQQAHAGAAAVDSFAEKLAGPDQAVIGGFVAGGFVGCGQAVGLGRKLAPHHVAPAGLSGIERGNHVFGRGKTRLVAAQGELVTELGVAHCSWQQQYGRHQQRRSCKLVKSYPVKKRPVNSG